MATLSVSMLLWIWLPVLLFSVLVDSIPAQQQARRITQTIHVRNQNNRPVEVYFVPPNEDDKEKWVLVTSPILMPGAGMNIPRALPGRRFVLQEKKQLVHQSEQQQEQQIDNIPLFFTALKEEGQVVTLTSEWTLDIQDAHTKAQIQSRGMLEECKQIVEQVNMTTTLTQCIQDKLQAFIEKTREDIRFHHHIRKNVLANHWEDFACDDNTLETSDPVYRTRWVNEREEESYDVSVLHDHSSSQIHLIEGFIDPHECDAIMPVTGQQLRPAMVHDGEGGQQMSDHRKAWQAPVKIPWKLPEHPLSQLSRRAYEYTNHVLGLNLEHHGQEHLMSIQYFGEGNETEQPDQYLPHCDGPCDGRPHKRGLRMATIVMYW
jgi:hypothetical protein